MSFLQKKEGSADIIVHNDDAVLKAASIMTFKTIHQFGGVLMGEHLGQLFTIIWTIMISIAFAKLNMVPKWVTWFGYISSFIYLLAQLDLFATVMPEIPVWEAAGFIGSTLWLVWLIVVGMVMVRRGSFEA